MTAWLILNTGIALLTLTVLGWALHTRSNPNPTLESDPSAHTVQDTTTGDTSTIDNPTGVTIGADELATLNDTTGCEWCLDGFTPAGTHPILGLVYHACPHCIDICACCDGTGLFPADTLCPHCLNEALTVLGLTVAFCHTCAGVLTVRPTLEVTP